MHEIETPSIPDDGATSATKGMSHTHQKTADRTLYTQNRKIVFGQCIEVLDMDEKLAVSVEDGTAGGKDGKQAGEVNDTISGDVIDSK